MKYISFLIALLFSLNVIAAEPIAGVWKTIDDETEEPKSLVQIYPYQGKMYGRVIKLFKNQDKRAVDIIGDPKILGLDVIWNMTDAGKRWEGGKILDPNKGKIYTCEIWPENGKLIVRGKIAFLGRNQTWVKDDSEPLAGLTPSIPLKK